MRAEEPRRAMNPPAASLSPLHDFRPVQPATFLPSRADSEMKRNVSLTLSEAELMARREEKLRAKKQKKLERGKAALDTVEPVGDSAEAPVRASSPKRKSRTMVEASPGVFSADDVFHITVPTDASFISDPSDLLGVPRQCLFPEDERRLCGFGTGKAAERILTQSFQVLQGVAFLEKEVSTLGGKNKELMEHNKVLIRESEEQRLELVSLRQHKQLLEAKLDQLQKDHDRRMEAENLHQKSLSRLRRKVERLEDERENIELSVSTATSYKLMKEFLEHQGSEWEPAKIIERYERFQEMERSLSPDEDDAVGDEEVSGEAAIEDLFEETTAKDVVGPSNPTS